MSPRKLGSWSVFGWVVLSAASLFSMNAMAAEAARFGVVHKISGTVQARDPSTGNARTLKANDVVRVGESIRSGADGEMVVRTDDSGVIAVRPKAEMAMERFSQGGAEGDRFSLNILTGAVRLVTGLIGQRSRENYQVTTPTATMGVRGTDFEVFVLDAESARVAKQREGSYNRVYRGATTVEQSGQILEVQNGQVGLAPAAPPSKTRALFTLLTPVLLDRVPDFFASGRFDQELAELVPAAYQQTTPTTPRAGLSKAPSEVDEWNKQLDGFATQRESSSCNGNVIANDWLGQLDAAIGSKDPQAIVRLFSDEAVIRLSVRSSGASKTEIEVDRSEFSKAVTKALANLQTFSTRRPRTATRVIDVAKCSGVDVLSIVEDKGVRDGNPFAAQSLESYRLELRAGKWIAVEASAQSR